MKRRKRMTPAEIQVADTNRKSLKLSELREAGGKVVTVRFTPEGAAALARAKADGYSINEAVNEALLGEWPDPA